MTATNVPNDDLVQLISALIDDDLSEQDHARLAQMLAGDAALRIAYYGQLRMHAQLIWNSHRAPALGLSDIGVISDANIPPLTTPIGDLSRVNDAREIVIPPLQPTLNLLSTTSPSPLGYFFSEGWLAAYLIATVIMGIGTLIGAFTYVSQPGEVAIQTFVVNEKVNELHTPTEQQMKYVGKITGMVDCQWEKRAEGGGRRAEDRNLPSPSGRGAGGEGGVSEDSIQHSAKSLVSLGDQFILASGLMEITYDTGAKVILQGPVTYEVDSKDGGYLSVGKLTAKLEKRAEGGGRKAEDRNLPSPAGRGAGSEGRRTRDGGARTQSALTLALSRQERGPNSNLSSLSTIHHPLFTIKTPTAVVTDLGTEFGVEVSKEGNTTSRVFLGVVEVKMADDVGKPGQAVRLTENESVRIEKVGDDGRTRIVRVAADLSAFVRSDSLPKYVEQKRREPFRRWQAYSEELRKDTSLLAYYDFQQAPGSPAVLRNVAANGDRSLDGVVENAAWVNGRMDGKHALRFGNESDYVQINLPQKTDDLTIAAWINLKILNVDGSFSSIVMSEYWKKYPGQINCQIRVDGRLVFGTYDGVNLFSSPILSQSKLSQWTHIAVVYDHVAARVKFYIDGHMTDELKVEKHVPLCFGPARIGQWNSGNIMEARNFRGKIDELAIFGRPLSTDEIQRMFEAGNPSKTGNNKSQP